LFNPQQFKSNRRTADVDDRIDRSDLMKMNLLNGLVVNPAFCFGEARKDQRRRSLHFA